MKKQNLIGLIKNVTSFDVLSINYLKKKFRSLHPDLMIRSPHNLAEDRGVSDLIRSTTTTFNVEGLKVPNLEVLVYFYPGTFYKAQVVLVTEWITFLSLEFEVFFACGSMKTTEMFYIETTKLLEHLVNRGLIFKSEPEETFNQEFQTEV